MTAIETLFAKLSISQKLWGGFAIILTLLAVVVVNTLFSLSHTKEKVDVVANEVQPTLIASMELMTELKETAAYLGFYLLTKEEFHKTNYHDHLTAIDEKLQALENTPVAKKTTETQAILADIQTKVAQFKAYESRMINLVEDETSNFAALRFAIDEINPINTEILQAMSDMVLSEISEAASEKRKLLYTDIQNLRYTWTNVVNNMRIFVTTGNKDVLGNIRLFMEGSNSLTQKIANQYDGMLTFEQEEAVAGLGDKLARYGKNLEALVKIHQSAKARTDAFLIRTEIGPLLEGIDGLLNTLVTQQRQNIETLSTDLINQTESTTNFVTILLFIGLLVGGGIA